MSWKYDYCRVNESDFFLKMKKNVNEQTSTGLIPKFQRVRTVSIVHEPTICQYLKCTCGYFEQTGIPCRHIICIRTITSANQIPITKYDVSVVHWSAYDVHGATPVADELTKALVALSWNDIKGPSIPQDYVELPIAPKVPLFLRPTTAAMSCENYTMNDISIAIGAYGNSSSVYRQAFINTQDSEEDEFQLHNDGLELDIAFADPAPTPNVAGKERNSYQQCAPSFKELMALIDGDSEMIQSLKEFLDKQIGLDKTKKHAHNASVQGTVSKRGRLVSSAIPIMRSHKTHGTNYFSKQN
jgi:hypothetical protein